MGGQAFTHLSTPRMTPSIYTHILTTTHAILRQHYQLVNSPIEAPGKQDFGDADIVVFSPLPSSPLHDLTSHPEFALHLSRILGAVQHIEAGPTMNFAIPWPYLPSQIQSHDLEIPSEKYVQLDIKVCDSEKMFNWELFHAAHGDLWNILGSTIRPFGLTVNDRGLFLRIPEIEKLDRKKGMVFLTDESDLILEFLGLEKERWWRELGSREEMFEYAAGCRLFWVKDEGEVEDGEVAGMGLEGGEVGKKKLKHNDRARMTKRPIFREWMEGFIPRCREEGRFIKSRGVTREQVRDEAFMKFGVEARLEFETRLKDWTLARHTDDMWRRVIKGSVPEIEDLQFRAASIRTLKGVIMEGDTFKGIVVAEVAPNEEGFWNPDKVREFVEANWKTAGDIGMARQQERAMEGMKAKAKAQAEKEQLQVEENANR